VGSRIAEQAADLLSPIGLIILAAVLLSLTLLLAGPEREAVPEGSRAISVDHARPVPRLLGGIGLVMRDRYLLLIALLAVLLNWINSTGEFILADLFKAEAQARVDASGGALDLGTLLTGFYGNYGFWVTLVSLGIQLFLVSRIFRVMGVRGALLIHPVIVLIAYGMLALGPLLGGFIPIFTLVRWIKVVENSIDYSLMNTTRQALFLPVDRDAKYDGKTAIDTFFWRIGDVLQALAIYVGVNHLQWTSSQFVVLNLLLALGWIVLAVKIGKGFSQKALDNVMNVAPEVGDPIPDLHYRPGQAFLHPVSPLAFRDADPGDVLTLRACCDDGEPLPKWMRFDERQRAFVGSVPHDVVVSELRVVVIASDVDGLEARSMFVVRSMMGAR
jgi:AAA family ATP:ADP antiporter